MAGHIGEKSFLPDFVLFFWLFGLFFCLFWSCLFFFVFGLFGFWFVFFGVLLFFGLFDYYWFIVFLVLRYCWVSLFGLPFGLAKKNNGFWFVWFHGFIVFFWGGMLVI